MSVASPSVSDAGTLAIEQERLISARQLREMIPISTTTLWRWTKTSDFPKPARINDRLFWRLADVRRWLAEKREAA